jgi:hypothetical protein
MPIDQLTIRNTGQGSGDETQDNLKFSRTAQLVMDITSNSPLTDNPDVIKAQSGYFAGCPHPFISFLYARSVNCVKMAPILYQLTVEFATRGKPGQSPLDEPPIISYDWAINDEVVDVDAFGKPMVFVTGEQPDPPTRDTVYDQVVRCQRNISVSQWNADLATIYAGKTNSDYFLNYPPGTCRITEPPRAALRNFQNTPYWEATMGVQVRRGVPGIFDDSKAWYKRVLAQGFYCMNARTDINSNIVKYVERATDKSGNPVIKPVLHDKTTGVRIFEDTTTGLMDPTKAQWYEWLPWTRRQVPFASLQFA